jgi:hypothetical protein
VSRDSPQSTTERITRAHDPRKEIYVRERGMFQNAVWGIREERRHVTFHLTFGCISDYPASVFFTPVHRNTFPRTAPFCVCLSERLAFSEDKSRNIMVGLQGEVESIYYKHSLRQILHGNGTVIESLAF